MRQALAQRPAPQPAIFLDEKSFTALPKYGEIAAIIIESDSMTYEHQSVDTEQSYFCTIKNSGDRTVGTLLMIVVSSFLFSVFFLGMYRTQSISDQIVHDHSHPSVHEEALEIGVDVSSLQK